jgi:hypothetical protein
MLRDVALLAVITATATFAQNNGTRQGPDSFDIQPPLLFPNRPDASLPEAKSSEAKAHDVDLAKWENDFERAKRNAVGAERLCKIGAISKLEAEQRALRVVRLESDLAKARLERAKEQAAALQSRLAGGEAVSHELEGAKTELARLTEAAQTAPQNANAPRSKPRKQIYGDKKSFSVSAPRMNPMLIARNKNSPTQAPKAKAVEATRVLRTDHRLCQFSQMCSDG